MRRSEIIVGALSLSAPALFWFFITSMRSFQQSPAGNRMQGLLDLAEDHPLRAAMKLPRVQYEAGKEFEKARARSESSLEALMIRRLTIVLFAVVFGGVAGFQAGLLMDEWRATGFNVVLLVSSLLLIWLVVVTGFSAWRYGNGHRVPLRSLVVTFVPVTFLTIVTLLRIGD